MNYQKVIFKLDELLCNKYCVPAKYYQAMNGDVDTAINIAKKRFVDLSVEILEEVGIGLTTYGLAKQGHINIFISGTVTEISARMMSMHLCNSTAAEWDLALNHKIQQLRRFRPAINSLLIDSGISSEEVYQLYSLPRKIYVTDLRKVVSKEIKKILGPVIVASAMFAYGDYWTAIGVLAIGLSAIPISKQFHNFDKQRINSSRIAVSAKNLKFQKLLFKKHVWLTNAVNFMAEMPKILFAIKYIQQTVNNNLAALNGITRGLKSLSASLSAQRQKEVHHRNTEIAIHLINSITSKPFIATEKNWQRHISDKGIDRSPKVKDFEKGIIIQNFKAITPSGMDVNMREINVSVKASEAVILEGSSGIGKSSTLMALLHLLEHKGEVYLVKNGKTKNIHELSGIDEVRKNIAYVTLDDLEPNDKLVDLFKEIYKRINRKEYEIQKLKYGIMMTEVAWSTADNLLQKEINKLRNSEKCTFPIQMLEDLIELRSERNKWVDAWINQQNGNLLKEEVNSQRVLTSLSSGEQRRMMVAVANAEVEYGEKLAVIIDEPLANLDSKNRQLQIQRLRTMQNAQSPVALIIVSLDYIDELKKGLKACQRVKLEDN